MEFRAQFCWPGTSDQAIRLEKSRIKRACDRLCGGISEDSPLLDPPFYCHKDGFFKLVLPVEGVENP